MYADDYEEIPHLIAGNIGALYGLKDTRTGDTLLMSSNSGGGGGKSFQASPFSSHHLQLSPITIPPPVFFCSVEPISKSDEQTFEEALKALVREDPSIHVSVDGETKQTLLGGMGELHLEIAAVRLKETHRLNVKMGKVMIAYRETVDLEFQEMEEVELENGDGVHEDTQLGLLVEEYTHDREVFGKKSWAYVKLGVRVLRPIYDLEELEALDSGSSSDNNISNNRIGEDEGGNLITISPLAHGSCMVSTGNQQQQQQPQQQLESNSFLAEIDAALRSGIAGALSRGPFIGYPVTNLHISVLSVRRHSSQPDLSPPSAIRAAAYRATQTLLKRAADAKTSSSLSPSSVSVFGSRGRLLEPVMAVSIRVPEKYVGVVVRDLGGARRGQILAMQGGEGVDQHVDNGADSLESSAPSSSSSDDHYIHHTIHARVPLSSMVGFTTYLRGMTQGTGNFSMKLTGYGIVQGDKANELVQSTF